MLVIKRWLAEDVPCQIVCVAPQNRLTAIKDTMGTQPRGVAPRRPISEETRKNLRNEVPKLLQHAFIGPEAADYLLRYGRGELSLPRRQSQYRCLEHRWFTAGNAAPSVVMYDEEDPLRGVNATLRDIEGHADPMNSIEDGIDVSEVRLHTELS